MSDLETGHCYSFSLRAHTGAVRITKGTSAYTTYFAAIDYAHRHTFVQIIRQHKQKNGSDQVSSSIPRRKVV